MSRAVWREASCYRRVVRALTVACVSFAAVGLPAQGILDVVDGETLYLGGSLLSFGNEYEREEVRRSGSARVADSAHAHRFTLTSTVAWQYGLRNDLQLGIGVPYVASERESATGQEVAAGIGDVELLAKWRFHRWDAPGVSINTSLITSLSLPFGDDDRRSNGVELEPELQAGSGGFDPAIGLAITPEPGRWRFNAAVLWRWRTDTDGDDDRRGDSLFAELAIGNRFWLEPYPGPFMRLDLFARYRHEDRDREDGVLLADSGGDRLVLGSTWAFRPRPSLDFQLTAEIPVWRDTNGSQLDLDWAVEVAFGYRF